jgi:DNA polymerase-3 subunit gamma/tau
MGTQAARFGLAELTHAAQTVNHALTEMSGATSPKLHLELMCAKVLVPSSDQTEVGSLARIERLERRIGMGGDAPVAAAPAAAAPAAAAQVAAPVNPAPKVEDSAPVLAAPAAVAPAPATPSVGGVSTSQFKDSWSDILSSVNKTSKSAWMVAFSLSVIDFTDEVLTLKFLSSKDLEAFKNASGASDILRKAIFEVLGVQVKFRAQVAEAPASPPTTPIAVIAPPVQEAPPVLEVPPAEEEPAPEEPEEAPVAEAPAAETKAPAAPTKSRNSTMVDESARYGESLLREMLGAEPIQDKNAGGR